MGSPRKYTAKSPSNATLTRGDGATNAIPFAPAPKTTSSIFPLSLRSATREGVGFGGERARERTFAGKGGRDGTNRDRGAAGAASRFPEDGRDGFRSTLASRAARERGIRARAGRRRADVPVRDAVAKRGEFAVHALFFLCETTVGASASARGK